jgi:septum formation protein
MKLLLASKSATRRRMLEAAGVPFGVAETEFGEAEFGQAQFDEENAKAELRSRRLIASELALALAEAKAMAVDAGPELLVLGCDQVLERADGSMLDKAGSRSELAEQLRSLRGRAHRLHSASVAVTAGEPVWRAAETATMHMWAFSDSFLESYLDREFDEVRWSVGGYHAEARGAQLFERIEGSHFAVLGLPLLPLLQFLREREILPT